MTTTFCHQSRMLNIQIEVLMMKPHTVSLVLIREDLVTGQKLSNHPALKTRSSSSSVCNGVINQLLKSLSDTLFSWLSEKHAMSIMLLMEKSVVKTLTSTIVAMMKLTRG